MPKGEVLSGCAVRATIQQEEEEAKTETSGAAKPPKEPPPVVAAAKDDPPAKITICPETGQECEENPPCILKTGGSCYCAKWVNRIRTDEIKRREKNAKASNT